MSSRVRAANLKPSMTLSSSSFLRWPWSGGTRFRGEVVVLPIAFGEAADQTKYDRSRGGTSDA